MHVADLGHKGRCGHAANAGDLLDRLVVGRRRTFPRAPRLWVSNDSISSRVERTRVAKAAPSLHGVEELAVQPAE